MDDEEEEEEVMEQGDDPAAPPDSHPAALAGSLPVTDCLFCSHHSRSLMKNVAHMTKEHSFFIPDLEFLVDLRGLLRYLGEFTPRGQPGGLSGAPNGPFLVFQERKSGLETCVCGVTRRAAPSTPPRPCRVT